MVTIIFPVVTSKGFYEGVGFLAFTSSDTLNLQRKYLIDEEGEERNVITGMKDRDRLWDVLCGQKSVAAKSSVCFSSPMSW